MKIEEIKDITYFTKGHRGLLYVGNYKKKKVVIKKKLAKSKAVGRIENEANSLKILNKKNIGPKLVYYDKTKDFLVYEYVDGELFPIFVRHLDKKNKNLIKKIIKQIFIQCFRMDQLKMNKEEMHHPYKHILIEAKTKKPVLLDFERCHYSNEGVNVTQFSSYIISGSITELLKQTGIKVNREKVIEAAKKYKRDVNKKNLDKLIQEVK
ncbi:hypothetical protein ISS05_02285, partial [Candidatus Woesearchaeota archaeon]|nr:hypothetical protein [Candidatus Woesearchaeota archaeon]